MSSYAPAAMERLEPRVCFSHPVGTEALINVTTTSTQSAVVVAAESDGDYVAVWESLSQDLLGTWGIYARMFTAAGVPKGPEILVNAGQITNDQRRPSVAVDASGNFAVAWDGAGLAGIFPSIYVQRYNSLGAAQGGAITVATGTLLQPRTNASIAMNSSGDFTVAWESTSQDALFTSGVYARLYAADGTVLTGEFAVNQTTAGDQAAPVVSATAGGYVIAWSGEGSGDTEGIFARRFSSAGTALGNEQLVNVTTAGTQTGPALAVSPSGHLLAVWSGPGSGDADGVFARRYDASLSPLTGELAINDQTTGAQSGAAVVFDSGGDYMIAWFGAGGADADGIYAREFAADGTARAGSVLINTTITGSQLEAAITSRGDNDYVVAWSGEGTGDTDGVFARLLANDLPTVTASVGSANYTENTSPVVVDTGLVLADTDHSNLMAATVSISVGYAAGQDVLAFSAQAGISAVWDSSTGVLTLTGVASLADYQAALRTITYVNTSDNPSTAARTLSFVVDDGNDVSLAATRGVTVTAINDAPVVVTSSGSAAYVEDGAAVAVDPGLTASDVDSALLASATIVISAGYVPGEDILLFTSQLGITGSWSAATGTLTLSGAATPADYQTALRTIAYANSSQNPTITARTLTFAVHDGNNPSASATRAVSVSAVNDAPTVLTSAGSASFIEDGPAVPIDASLSVDDVDSALLTGATVQITSGYLAGQDALTFTSQSGITGSWDATTGTLTLTGSASVANYQTALRSVGYANSSQNPGAVPRTISIIVGDGSDSSLATTRSLVVTAVNDVPVLAASGGAASFTEDDPVVPIDTGLTVSDVDSTTLTGATVQITSGYQAGQDSLAFTSQLGITATWDVTTGSLTLTGTASISNYQTALRSIGYANTSQNPDTAGRIVAWMVNDGTGISLTATRSLTVVAANDAPVIATSGGSSAFTEDGPAAVVDAGITVSDVDSTALTGAMVWISSGYSSGFDVLTFVSQFGITSSWDATTGTLTLSGTASTANYQSALRTVTYHNLSQSPTTTTRLVRLTLNDGLDTSGPAARSLSVTAVNDPPIASVSSGFAVFVESSAPVAIDAALNLSDVDSASFAWATVRIATGYDAPEDELLYTAQFGVAGNWDASLGVLTLSGTASVAHYIQILRDVRYSNSSSNPSLTLRTFEFAVSDGIDTSSTASRSAIITAIDNPPSIDVSAGVESFTEDGPAIAVDASLSIEDLDSPVLFGISIAISTGYLPGEDILLFADQLGIVGSWDTSSGVLTLVGVAGIADYQTAVRSVLYANMSQNPDTSGRIVSFTATDGTGFSSAVTRQLFVNAVNDAPVVAATGSPVSFVENAAPMVVDPGLSVSDIDSATLGGATIRIDTGYSPGDDRLDWTPVAGLTGAWDASTGTLVLLGTAGVAAYEAALRSVVFVNNSDNPSLAPRSVVITVDDGTAHGSGVVTVSIDGVNDSPTLVVTPTALEYAVPGTVVAVDAELTVSDSDSPVLDAATVTITTGFVAGEDELGVTEQAGLTARWDSLTGMLTITGSASPAVYQAVLRSVTFVNTRHDHLAAALTIVFTVSDGSDTGLGVRLVAVAGSTIDPEQPPVDPPAPPVTDPPPEPIVTPPEAPPAEPPLTPPADPPAGSTETPPDAPPAPADTPDVVPQLPPPSVPLAPVVTVPPAGPSDPPAVPIPPTTPPAPPAAPTDSPIQLHDDQGPAVAPPSAFVEARAEPKLVAGTIQLIEAPTEVGGLSDGRFGTGPRSRLTTAMVEVGGTLGVGYVVWLLVNYSVVRHSILALPRFNPMDVHCLLSLASSRRRLVR